MIMRLYPVSSEKSINLISKENTIVFVVDKSATKPDVKKAVETEFQVKVVAVRINNTFQGKKRALVKLAKENLAIDLASKLKIL